MTVSFSAGWDYVDLLSEVGETNRCPGGKRTILRIARRLGIGPHTRVLEIGSNTGFSSIELVKLTGCTAVGIDVNPSAVAEAERRRRALVGGRAERVRFQVADAGRLPFADGQFDVLVCGGANGFIADLDAAYREYRRVLRPYGFLSITHLYYRQRPDEGLQRDLREVLGFPVPLFGMEEWLRVLAPAGWEILDLECQPLTARPQWVVDAYATELCFPARLSGVDTDRQRRLREQWHHTMDVFNRNHAYLGFMELTLRPYQDGDDEQPELFLAPGVYDPYFERAMVRP